jgi:hypothetical protein
MNVRRRNKASSCAQRSFYEKKQQYFKFELVVALGEFYHLAKNQTN